MVGRGLRQERNRDRGGVAGRKLVLPDRLDQLGVAHPEPGHLGIADAEEADILDLATASGPAALAGAARVGVCQLVDGHGEVGGMALVRWGSSTPCTAAALP